MTTQKTFTAAEIGALLKAVEDCMKQGQGNCGEIIKQYNDAVIISDWIKKEEAAKENFNFAESVRALWEEEKRELKKIKRDEKDFVRRVLLLQMNEADADQIEYEVNNPSHEQDDSCKPKEI